MALLKCSESSSCPWARCPNAHSLLLRITLLRHLNRNYTLILSKESKQSKKQGYLLWVEACNPKSSILLENIFLENLNAGTWLWKISLCNYERKLTLWLCFCHLNRLMEEETWLSWHSGLLTSKGCFWSMASGICIIYFLSLNLCGETSPHYLNIKSLPYWNVAAYCIQTEMWGLSFFSANQFWSQTQKAFVHLLWRYMDILCWVFNMYLNTKDPIRADTHCNPLGLWAAATASPFWQQGQGRWQQQSERDSEFLQFWCLSTIYLNRLQTEVSPFKSIRLFPPKMLQCLARGES